MPLLKRLVQALVIHPIRTWKYHLTVIQTSGPVRCHGQVQMPGDIRVVWIQTAVPTDAPTVLGLPGHGGVVNWILWRSIQDIPGGNAGRPYPD